MLSKLELRRKVWHMVMGLGFIILVYLGILNIVGVMALLMAAIIVYYVQKRRMSRAMNFMFEMFEREENIKDHPALGMIFYLMGALVVMAVLPLPVFLAVMLILTLGDAIAPLVGQFGQLAYFNNEKKKVLGVVMGMVAGGLGAWLFVPWYEAFLAAFFAMGLEGLDLKLFGWQVDDNFLIPIIGGLVIGVLRVLV